MVVFYRWGRRMPLCGFHIFSGIFMALSGGLAMAEGCKYPNIMLKTVDAVGVDGPI